MTRNGSPVTSDSAHALRTTRPALCQQLWNDSGSPRPRTMNDFAPIDPGMIPITPCAARTAPMRVISTVCPKWFSRVT